LGQQGVWHHLAMAAHGVEHATEVNGVPQRYGGRDQGEPACTMLLCFDSPVAQLAKAMEADSTRESIAGLALIELRCCLAPELRLF
jgi:hypothetical protein